MNFKFTLLKAVVCIAFFLKPLSGQSQCVSSFTGLLSNYCSNSPSSTLSPSPSGGQFIGPVLSGSVFSPSSVGPGTYTIMYGFCSSSYSVESNTTNTLLPFGPYTVTSTESPTVLTLSDDQLSSGINIGFPFQFFCNTYSVCYISSNGFITFNPSSGNGCCSGAFMPSSTTPDDLIACAWTDLYPPAGGTISAITIGTAPTRTFLVNYIAIPHFSGQTNPVTQQIKLMEGTNLIEIHTTTKPNNSQTTTMGIQNLGATIAYPVTGRNANNSWSATNEMVRFTPIYTCTSTQTTIVSPTSLSVTGTNSICTGGSTTLTALGNTTYTWTSPVSSNSQSVIVNPTANTAYSVSATNSFGCVSNAVYNVTVFAGAPVLSINSSTNNVCLGKTVTLTATGAVAYSWSGGITNGVGFVPTSNSTYVVTGSNSCGSTTAAVSLTVAPLPVAAIVTPTTICAGNIATLSAVAAATNYTWLPINAPGATAFVSPAVNTIFTVTASDGTCAGSTTVALNTVAVPTITAVSSSSNICAGESVTLTASGGQSYTWTPGQLSGGSVVVSPTAPTLFAVVGDNSAGCTGTSNIPVIVSPSPTLTLGTSAPLICAGESVTLTVSGADTYSWSSGGTTTTETVSPIVSTVFSIVGTSTINFCATTETINVDVFTPIVTITGNTAICSGATATMIASGASTYTWSNGTPAAFASVNPSATTIYTVSSTSATNNITCASNNTFQVTVHPNPVVNASSSRAEMCKSETVTLSATGALNYLWNTGANTPSITATSSLVTTMLFTVTGTNSQGCSTATIVQVKVNGCVGIEENPVSEKQLSVYPNPNNGEFVIQHAVPSEFILVNELGQLVRMVKLTTENNYTLNITGLSGGIYFLKGINNEAGTGKKIVIQK